MTQKEEFDLIIASKVCSYYHTGEPISDEELIIAINELRKICLFSLTSYHKNRYIVFYIDLRDVLTGLQGFATERGLNVSE